MSLDTVIRFANATIFIKDHMVLSDVNFEINKGEFTYLIGKVGSGKTSLIKTINAEYPLQQGEGFVADYPLHSINRKQIPYLRRKLGIVFQDFQLLTDRTVTENLGFVLKATGWKNKVDIEKRISEVLERVGLSVKGYKMPHQLSGGEQQRVVIARALLNDPEIILADEPTGNLDSKTSIEIMKLFGEIHAKGNTIILVTHEEFIARYAHRIIRLLDGQVDSIEINENPDK